MRNGHCINSEKSILVTKGSVHNILFIGETMGRLTTQGAPRGVLELLSWGMQVSSTCLHNIHIGLHCSAHPGTYTENAVVIVIKETD